MSPSPGFMKAIYAAINSTDIVVYAAGTFTTTWDASDMPSGVYFYRITASDYVRTRKMVLMR